MMTSLENVSSEYEVLYARYLPDSISILTEYMSGEIIFTPTSSIAVMDQSEVEKRQNVIQTRDIEDEGEGDPASTTPDVVAVFQRLIPDIVIRRFEPEKEATLSGRGSPIRSASARGYSSYCYFVVALCCDFYPPSLTN